MRCNDFLWDGSTLSTFPPKKIRIVENLRWLGGAFLLGHILLLLFVPYKYDMHSMNFGFPPIFTITALLGILGWVFLAETWPLTKLALFLSQNTIPLFVFQRMFTSILGIILGYLGFAYQPVITYAMAYTIIGISTLPWAGCLLRQYIPWVIGEPRRKKQ